MENSIIIDINGNPILKPALREPQTSHVRGLANTFAEHPSHRLTPARLHAILIEAEQGNLIRQSDLFTDMEERDAHLFAEMQKRKRKLLTIDYEVTPPPNATPDERRDAAWLAEFVTELDAWEDLLIDMLDAVGQGFSNVEIRWEMYGREWHPAEFMHRPASWFQLDKNDQNRLLLRTDDGQGAALRPLSWIQHRHKSRSGYIARAGLMRTLCWPYIYRNFGAQSLAEMLEIYGVPIRIGKYPAGIGKPERDALMRAVTELGRYAGGIIPDSMKIELTQAASGSHAPHMALAEWAEKSMSKAILGGTLTSQADGKTSTNALGVIHNDVRRDLLISDAKQIAATVRADLFLPMLRLNRRPDTDPRRVPRLKFVIPEENADGTAVSAPAAGTDALSRLLVAALTRSSGDKAQRGIDSGIAALLNSGQPADGLVDILQPLLAATAAASGEAALLGALAESFPAADPALLARNLGDSAALARIIGYAVTQEV